MVHKSRFETDLLLHMRRPAYQLGPEITAAAYSTTCGFALEIGHTCHLYPSVPLSPSFAVTFPPQSVACTKPTTSTQVWTDPGTDKFSPRSTSRALLRRSPTVKRSK
eukprot:1195442-Prorocentrum_minimum.AAC.3